MISIKAIPWEDDNSTKAINLNLAFNFVCAQRRCETSSEIISLIMMWTSSPFSDMFLSHFLSALSQKSWQTEQKLFFFFFVVVDKFNFVSKSAVIHILTFAWALIRSTNEAIWSCSLYLHPRNPLYDLCWTPKDPEASVNFRFLLPLLLFAALLFL